MSFLIAEERSSEQTNRSTQVASGGRPLSASNRSDFEGAFGQPFDDVRIHDGRDAARANDLLGARAFTQGNHIYFGSGEYSPGSPSGRELLAHELTHVAQQRDAREVDTIQYQLESPPRRPDSYPKLDKILPEKVGLVTHIDRVSTLLHLFSRKQLKEHVNLIYNHRAATEFTQHYGVPGIVALYDTRRGQKIDVGKARQAIKQASSRYKRQSLKTLNLRPRTESQTPYWFQDPANLPSAQQPSKGPIVGKARRSQVHVQQQLAQVGNIHVRFAFPASEISPTSGLSKDITQAKQSILQTLAQLVADVGSYSKPSSQEEKRKKERTSARLQAALSGFSKSSPLNIFIASELSKQELSTGQVAATTGAIFVNKQDIGNPQQLQAAIRMPLMMMKGGMVPTAAGPQQVPKASKQDLKSTLLHEAIHVKLLRHSSDANSVWERQKANLTIKGGRSVRPKFVELVRKYLIAQEEVFAYENEASEYPSTSNKKATYESFIKNTSNFLQSKADKSKTISRSIPVNKKVAGKKVTWEVTYSMPAGSVNLSVSDIQVMDLLLTVYPGP